jgi:hypothetical protein
MMHATLKPATNIKLMVVWAVLAVLVTVIGSPTPWIFLLAGAVFGAVAGWMQLLAFREASGAMLAAQTAMEVRRALSSSRWGRRYLVTLWVGVLFLFVLAAYLLRGRAFIGLLAGYSAFAFTRELLTLRGTFELKRLSTGQMAPSGGL